MDRLLESLETAPIVDKDGYEYLVHSISNGVPKLDPELLREVTVEVMRRIDLDVDKLVAPEAMGIHLATSVSLQSDVPLTIIRKRPYDLENERQLSKETGYSHSEMYVNEIYPDDRIVIVDDLLSTGGPSRLSVRHSTRLAAKSSISSSSCGKSAGTRPSTRSITKSRVSSISLSKTEKWSSTDRSPPAGLR